MSDEQRATEVNDVRPTSLAHIIGQQSVVEQVRVGIEAAFQDQRRFDHSLLVGPPGVGKSAVANVIAQEMATTLHEVIGQSLNSAGDLNGFLLQAARNDVLHIDEAHELPKTIQTALYLALDQRTLFVRSGNSITPISLESNCEKSR